MEKDLKEDLDNEESKDEESDDEESYEEELDYGDLDEEGLEEEKIEIEAAIERKNNAYKAHCLQCVYYMIFVSIALIFLIAAIFSLEIFKGTYLGGWIWLVLVLSFISLLILAIAFFGRFEGIDRIIEDISLKRDIQGLKIQLRTIEKYKAAYRPQAHKYKDEISSTIRQYQVQAKLNSCSLLFFRSLFSSVLF